MTNTFVWNIEFSNECNFTKRSKKHKPRYHLNTRLRVWDSFPKTTMTSSNGNIFRGTGPFCRNSPVTDDFPSQRPVTRSFDVFFDLRPNKRSGKQSRRRWFETLSHSLWRHCNVILNHIFVLIKSILFLPYQMMIIISIITIIKLSNCRNSFAIVSCTHYGDVIMGTMASQITSLTIVYSTVYSGADQRKHQSSASLAFVTGKFHAQNDVIMKNV